LYGWEGGGEKLLGWHEGGRQERRARTKEKEKATHGHKREEKLKAKRGERKGETKKKRKKSLPSRKTSPPIQEDGKM